MKVRILTEDDKELVNYNGEVPREGELVKVNTDVTATMYVVTGPPVYTFDVLAAKSKAIVDVDHNNVDDRWLTEARTAVAIVHVKRPAA